MREELSKDRAKMRKKAAKWIIGQVHGALGTGCIGEDLPQDVLDIFYQETEGIIGSFARQYNIENKNYQDFDSIMRGQQ